MINLIFGFLFLSSMAGLTPEESYEETFEDCLHEESIEFNYRDWNVVILVPICSVANDLDTQLIIISVHRPESKGDHRHGSGIDHYRDYSNMDSCEVWQSYEDYIDRVIDKMEELGIDNYSIGIYLPNEKGKGQQLSVHIGLRKKFAHWSFIGGKQFPYELGRMRLRAIIRKECE